MRTRTVLVSIALLLAALVVPAFAADEKRHSLQITGEVVSVDAAESSITVRGNDVTSATFEVNASTKITRDGEAIELGELAKGDKVSVTYEKQAQANVAVMIGVISSDKA